MKFYRLLPLLILPFLVACEGNTDFTWSVNNQSAGTITISGLNSIYADTLNLDIQAGQQEVIGVFSQLGGNSTPQIPSGAFSTLVITNSVGDTTTKNYEIQANWEVLIEQTRKIPSNYEHNYTFTVNDSDF